VTVTFDCFGSTLRAFDVPEVRGFAVCGEDRVWHWATGKVVGKDSVELAVRSGAATDRRTLRVGRQPGVQSLLAGRSARDAFPDGLFRDDHQAETAGGSGQAALMRF
jgi:hypothetical protein